MDSKNVSRCLANKFPIKSVRHTFLNYMEADLIIGDNSIF